MNQGNLALLMYHIQSRLSYLLRIDERWASPEIIRAREVIHEFYLDAKKR